MKILFLTHYFYPEANAPARRVYELTRRWVRSGGEVTVVTGVPNVPRGIPYPGYRNGLLREETIEGVRVRRVWTYLAPNRARVRRSLNYISFMVSGTIGGLPIRPDVVVATTPQLLCAVAGRWVAGARRLPFVLDVRDIWPASISAVGAVRRGKMLSYLERIERGLYRAAVHVVTVGEGYARHILSRRVSAATVSVIPNGVDLQTFSPRPCRADMRARWGIERGAFVCLYAGTVGMACGLDVVLQAAEKLRGSARGVMFVIAGDGARLDELKSQAHRRGLRRVTFTGRIRGSEIPDVIACADVCLVHLRSDPLFETVVPSKMFEAAAMGKPLLVGLLGEGARWVERAGAGICFRPGDADSLLEALEFLRRNPEVRAEMGRRGRAFVVQEHDYDKLAAKYLGILEHVLGGE
ncbi:MAG TPA: glycosyltransferase WbuB [Kiritimatiellae bacterium]|nr:glycosyltransferase WbuB [Kiritimatiellia bacterium]